MYVNKVDTTIDTLSGHSEMSNSTSLYSCCQVYLTCQSVSSIQEGFSLHSTSS